MAQKKTKTNNQPSNVVKASDLSLMNLNILIFLDEIYLLYSSTGISSVELSSAAFSANSGGNSGLSEVSSNSSAFCFS